MNQNIEHFENHLDKQHKVFPQGFWSIIWKKLVDRMGFISTDHFVVGVPTKKVGRLNDL